MGIHDRAYVRDEQSGGPGWSPSSMMWVTRLVLLNVVIFLIDSLLINAETRTNPLSDFLALDSDLFRTHIKFYELLTAGFAHAPLGKPHGIWHILGNMFILWMLGRDVERQLGWREFLCFYLVAIVVANLTWWAITVLTAPDQPSRVIGASGGVAGVVILYAFLFPKRKLLLWFVIEIPAWVFGVLWVGMDIFGMMAMDRSGVAFSAHLGGAAFAAIYHLTGLRFMRYLGGMKRFTSPGGRARSRLRIHRPEKKKSESLDREADRVLEKLYQEGEASLTSKERRTLEAYSRRMRSKHGNED